MTNTRSPRAFPDATRLCGRRIVVVAPHPDDDIFGCGLLLARAARAGVPFAVVALTDGQASHPGSRRWPAKALARLRRAELRRALARLGAKVAPVRFLGWGDGRLAADGRALRLRTVLRSLRAGVVLVTSPADHHPDHKAAWALAVRALGGTRVPLVAYEVWSRVDRPRPGRVRDPGCAAKRWAAGAHRSQIGNYIADDPDGFTFAPDVLRRMLEEPERFHW